MMGLDEDEGYQRFDKPAERRPAWVFQGSADFSEERGSFSSPKLWGKRWNAKKGAFLKMCLLDGFVEITNEKRMFFKLQHILWPMVTVTRTWESKFWPVLHSFPNKECKENLHNYSCTCIFQPLAHQHVVICLPIQPTPQNDISQSHNKTCMPKQIHVAHRLPSKLPEENIPSGKVT